MSYNGKKFRVIDTQIVQHICGKMIEKATFAPTKAYMKWLQEQELAKQQLELQILKAKLEYQHKTYGEVDSIDFANYINLINKA